MPDPEFNMQSEEKKEYLKLFVFRVNPDNVWGVKLCRSKGLSLAEMGTFGKSARPCTFLYIVHYTEFLPATGNQ